MTYKLQDLIDLEHFQNLQDRLNEIYSFPSSIIDNEGNILTATAWQEVCTRFHRKHKECERECIKSDRYILDHLHEADPAVSYRCPHGLVDNATPIVIDGVHYGNFFTGQFFMEEPDLGFFWAQAHKYGFEEDAYIEAVKRVPIWKQKQLDNYLFFIKGLIAVIAESGLKKLKEIENRKLIEASDNRHRSILKSAMDGYWLADTEGRLLEVNDSYCIMSGYSEEELLTMRVSDLEAVENPQLVVEHLQKVAVHGSDRFESKHRRKGGTVFDVEVSVQFRPEEGGQCVCFLRDITERNQAEKALLQSEGKWRNILINTPQIGISLNPTAEIIFANERFLSVTGWLEHEVIGQNWFDMFIPEDVREEMRGVFHAVMEQKDTLGFSTYENEIVGKSGEIFNMAWSNVLTKDSYGNVVDVTCLGVDITERKRAERSLIESESKIRSILETAMDGFVLIDINGNILEANETYCRMSGYSEKELLRMTIADIEVLETPAEVAARIRKIIEMGQVRFETGHQRKDGTIMDIEGSVQYQQTDGGRLVVFIRDISEQKRNEKYNSMLVEMLDAAPDSIIIHDNDGRFLYANRKTFEMHGYEKIEFMGLNLHDLDVPASEKLIEDRIRTILEKGETTFIVEHYRKDGAVIPLSVSVKSVDWEGKPALLSIATDITESRQAESEKNRLEMQLHQAQKMEAVGRLAGGVAHDFNNMLSLILGHAELALEETGPSHPLYANIEEIKMAGKRSAELTRQLLAFARKQTIAPRKLDLNDTLKGMLQMLRRLIGEDIELGWIPGNELWAVKLDPGQVDQILVNLCVNARDAIKDVGKITIETKNMNLDESYCEDHMGPSPGSYVRLSVSDNGCGMGTETLENIFEPFFTTKGIGKGTGLGLSTVYGIVKQNNGFIDVYSEPGRGTIFKIYLPRYEANAIEALEKREKKSVEKGYETILIVEDEPAILAMTKMMLKKTGYNVLAAKTPGEAIRIAQEYPGNIDLLLTDVVMPEMNGRDLSMKIMSLYPNLKRIFMSGYTANVIAHHGVLEKGVNFIQKPYSRMDLGSKVREVLDAD